MKYNKVFIYRFYSRYSRVVLSEKVFRYVRFVCNKMLNDRTIYYDKKRKILKIIHAKYMDAYSWLKVIVLCNLSINQTNVFDVFYRKQNYKFKYRSKHNTVDKTYNYTSDKAFIYSISNRRILGDNLFFLSS